MANKSASAEVIRSTYLVENFNMPYSKELGRQVEVELIRPADAPGNAARLPLLILNDGQDNGALQLVDRLTALTRNLDIPPILVAAVKAGDRMQEYGLSARPDFLGRGKKSSAYASFVIQELVPHLMNKYAVIPDSGSHAIAGYSLGGLSALDIAWNHPTVFSKVGVFSGSLWWRKRDTRSPFYSDDRDRLMHQQIRKSKYKKGLQFWFQTGTLDETNDRNKNGIIDSIDDTMDLIVELTKKGYRPFQDIQYLEIQGGKHNPATWGEAMPNFLKWAFGKRPLRIEHES